MLIDTHAHLNFPDYNTPNDETIARCLSYPMRVINIGVDYESSEEVVALAEKYPDNFKAAVGLHPDDGFAKEFLLEKFRQLIKDHRASVVAIGECGLDFFRWKELGDDFQTVFNKQLDIFQQHVELAKEFNLPLVIHARNSLETDKPSAYGEVFKVLQQADYFKAVFHCFTGAMEQAQQFTEKGLYLGFTGIITFPKGDNIREIAKITPSDRMLIETDAPFLAPQLYRGKRNEPIFVEEVAKKIAELRGWSLEETIEQTWQNARNLFKI